MDSRSQIAVKHHFVKKKTSQLCGFPGRTRIHDWVRNLSITANYSLEGNETSQSQRTGGVGRLQLGVGKAQAKSENLGG